MPTFVIVTKKKTGIAKNFTDVIFFPIKLELSKEAIFQKSILLVHNFAVMLSKNVGKAKKPRQNQKLQFPSHFFSY